MSKRVLLVSTPAPAVEQTTEEKEYWKWHYALKTKLTYSNLSKKQLLKLGNSENQNVGLLSIASVLKDNGINVQYLAPSLDFSRNQRESDFLETLLEQIKKIKSDFVGFSSHTCGILNAINYAKEIKKITPEIKTVIGGPHATGSSKETLEELMKNFDFVIKGKGEIPFLRLVEDISASTISFRKYPNPANDLLNIKELPAARVFSSLGCGKDFQCIFCADSNRGFIKKPVENVIREIKYFYNNFKTRYFYFGDENFFFNKKRSLQMMDEINYLDLDIIVGYQARIESVDKDLIKKAAESEKCTEIQYGVESASQKILNLNKKGLRIQKVKEICDLTKSYGINTHCYFLVGLPGETQETAELTIKSIEEFIKDRSVDFVEYRCAVPFPGAPMWELAEKYGVKIKHKNWEEYRGENKPPFDLKDLTSKQIYEFYLEGLKKITKLYKNRYLKEFGNQLLDVNVLSAVTEGGF